MDANGLAQWFSAKETVCPRAPLAMPGDIFAVTVGEEVLLASSGCRPGVLLTMLQCTGQQRMIWSPASTVLRLRN